MIINPTVFHINIASIIPHIIICVFIQKPCLNAIATHTRIQIIVVDVVIHIKPIKLICFVNKVTLIHAIIIVAIVLGNIAAVCWIEAVALREIIHRILEIMRLLLLLLLILLLLLSC